MTERPTLKTISKMTGLAIATVSRALHDAPDISTQTKERVRACAEQIGYQPNRAGVRLRTGRTHVVAMMLATEADITSHSSQLVAAVAAKMHDSGYFLNIAPSGPKEDTLRAVQQVVQSRAADAIILNRTEADDPRVAYLMERRFPFVTHGRTIWSDDHAWVDFDNRRFAEIGMQTLAKRGRKTILIIAPPPSQFYGQEIRDAIEATSTQLGLTPVVLNGATSESSVTQIESALQQTLDQTPQIDGVFCASVLGSVAAVDVIERRGRILGQDFDAFSKEASPLLRRFRRDFIVLHEDVAGAGADLARAVLGAIDAPDASPLQLLHVPKLEDVSPH